MVLAVEPMTTAGRHMVRMGDDGWAIYSQDGSLAAHFEFTIAVTADGPRILTPWHESKARRRRGLTFSRPALTHPGVSPGPSSPNVTGTARRPAGTPASPRRPRRPGPRERRPCRNRGARPPPDTASSRRSARARPRGARFRTWCVPRRPAGNATTSPARELALAVTGPQGRRAREHDQQLLVGVVGVQRRHAAAGIDLVERRAELLGAGRCAHPLAAQARQLGLPLRAQDVRHPPMIADTRRGGGPSVAGHVSLRPSGAAVRYRIRPRRAEASGDCSRHQAPGRAIIAAAHARTAILLGRALGREVPVRHFFVRGMVAAAAPAARATPSGSSAERDHEGTTVGQADVREVQDHPPPRAGPRDLPEPAPQAAAGVGSRWLASQASTFPSTSASRSA